jgi:hypothetical protein
LITKFLEIYFFHSINFAERLYSKGFEEMSVLIAGLCGALAVDCSG